jgi:hypothetical protein
MNILLVSLVVLLVVAVCLYFFLHKKDNKNNNLPTNIWTGDQLKQSLDIIKALYPNPPLQNILQQLVSELSKKVSFKDFMSSNNKYELVYGVKGKWSDTLKNYIIQSLMDKRKIKSNCASCIVGKLENEYSPKDFNNFNVEDMNKAVDLMLKKCGTNCPVV